MKLAIDLVSTHAMYHYLFFLAVKDYLAKNERNDLINEEETVNNDIEMENMQNMQDIEDIENKLLEFVDNNHSQKDDIAFATPIVMVDAFMRCKILEKPDSK